MPLGRVKSIDHDQGSGFIQSEDKCIFFDVHVTDNFKDLEVGSVVFVKTDSSKGEIKAISVNIINIL